MSLNKRIKGDYTIESIDSTDKIIMHKAGGITIEGNLTVTGTSSTVESTDTFIVDNEIVLNSGETGNGVANGTGTSGILIDRGTAINGNAGIRFDENSGVWEVKNGDGTGWNPIASGSVATPPGGANTQIQYNNAGSFGGTPITYNGTDITIASNVGVVKVEQELSLKEQATPAGVSGYNKLSAGTAGSGGTGLYFANDTETDELVSKKKAIVFGLIF